MEIATAPMKAGKDCNRHAQTSEVHPLALRYAQVQAEMKEWFAANRKFFMLGLSLNGAKETHDANRSNSFDTIDFDFFLKNWPDQGVNMPLSLS